MAELTLGGTYQHYKTKALYQPVALVTDASNGKPDGGVLVLYFGFLSGRLFVRPRLEFMALVDGEPRFKLMTEG